MCAFVLENKKRIQRQQVVGAGVLILIAAAMFLFCMPTAHALIEGQIESIFETILANVFVDITQGHGPAVAKIFTGDISLSLSGVSTGGATTISDMITHVMLPFKTIAIALAVLYAVISLINAAKSEALTLETVLKIMVRSGFAIALVIFSDVLIDAIQRLCIWFVQVVGNNLFVGSFETSTNVDEFIRRVSDIGFLRIYDGTSTFVRIFITLLLVKLLSAICSVFITFAVKIVAYSILLEICLRKVFFPIAVVTVASDGFRSSGITYMKRFAAVYLRMILVIFAFYAAGALASDDIVNQFRQLDDAGIINLFNSGAGVVFLIKVALYDAVALIFTTKASELANEALGV